jgi:hypothetical protein
MRPASFQTYERGTYEATMAWFVELQTAMEPWSAPLYRKLTIPDVSVT